MARKTWRLVDALLLFLLFLLPLMLIVGRGEGTIERATLLFWLMLILPLLILPWLWRGAIRRSAAGRRCWRHSASHMRARQPKNSDPWSHRS